MTTDPRTVNPASSQLWLELAHNTQSDVFHSPQWMRVLSRTYDFEPEAIVCLDDNGNPQSGIAFMEVNGLSGPMIRSLPFSDFADPLTADEGHWRSLIDAVLDRGLPISLRMVHSHIAAADSRFDPTGTARWHGVDTARPIDEIWDSISASARRAIRKSRSAGLVIRPSSDQVDRRRFFEMHLHVRKTRHRLLAQPYGFFEAIYEEFLDQDDGVLMLAELSGEVIGGVLFLEWNDRLYYKFNAWQGDLGASRPNDAVMWAGIEYCVERELTRLDLGLSDADQEGLLRYKRKYASEEKEIQFLTANRAMARPSGQADLINRLVTMLTHPSVPDKLTEKAGNTMYRLFV